MIRTIRMIRHGQAPSSQTSKQAQATRQDSTRSIRVSAEEAEYRAEQAEFDRGNREWSRESRSWFKTSASLRSLQRQTKNNAQATRRTVRDCDQHSLRTLQETRTAGPCSKSESRVVRGLARDTFYKGSNCDARTMRPDDENIPILLLTSPIVTGGIVQHTLTSFARQKVHTLK
jgi:hypothetical protein